MMKKVMFKIIGMHCVSCSLAIDGDLEDIEGVMRAETNYAKQVTIVEFDPKKVSENDIIVVIAKTGYTAQVAV